MGFTRLTTPREFEIRTENRYTLHPIGCKRCTKCEKLYENIPAYFDVHRLTKDGTIAYTGQCKQCLVEIRAARTAIKKTAIETYAPRLVAGIKCRARDNNLPYDIDAQYLIDLWNSQHGRCYYTGDSLDLSAAKNTRAPHIDFPSVDKMVPSKGYVKGNIVWTKYGINRMKNDLTHEQFFEFCQQVVDRRTNGV